MVVVGGRGGVGTSANDEKTPQYTASCCPTRPLVDLLRSLVFGLWSLVFGLWPLASGLWPILLVVPEPDPASPHDAPESSTPAPSLPGKTRQSQRTSPDPSD